MLRDNAEKRLLVVSAVQKRAIAQMHALGLICCFVKEKAPVPPTSKNLNPVEAVDSVQEAVIMAAHGPLGQSVLKKTSLERHVIQDKQAYVQRGHIIAQIMSSCVGQTKTQQMSFVMA